MIRRIAAVPAIALAIAVLAPAPVAAHAELTSTSPADGEELTPPPDEVVMVFDGELDPEGSSFTVTDASGAEVGAGEVDLEVAERNEMRGVVEIAGPGEYTVAWAATAADGHPEEGTFTFTVADDAGGGGSGETPNTALQPTGPSSTAVLGLMLVALGIALGLRTRGRVRP